MGVAGARVDKQLHIGAQGIAGGGDDGAVQPSVVGPAKRPPADLEGREAARLVRGDDIVHALGHLHQQ